MGILDGLFRKNKAIPAATVFAGFARGRRQLHIVGQSHHQPEIRRVMNTTSSIRVQANLVPEPGNAQDSHAVAVHVLGEVVGYLAKSNALTFHREMAALGYDGRSVSGIDAGVYEASQDNYGIFLMMPSDIVFRMLEDDAKTHLDAP